MILDVPYVEAKGDVSSPDAAFAMVASFVTSLAPSCFAGNYDRAFVSHDFTRWLISSRGLTLPSDRVVVACMEYISGPELRLQPVSSRLDALYGSYIKRQMPVMLYGDFPFMGGTTMPNLVVLIGKVGPYLIFHDPRGNANTGYGSSYGERVLYHEDDVKRWLRASAAGCVSGVRAELGVLPAPGFPVKKRGDHGSVNDVLLSV